MTLDPGRAVVFEDQYPCRHLSLPAYLAISLAGAEPGVHPHLSLPLFGRVGCLGGARGQGFGGRPGSKILAFDRSVASALTSLGLAHLTQGDANGTLADFQI